MEPNIAPLGKHSCGSRALEPSIRKLPEAEALPLCHSPWGYMASGLSSLLLDLLSRQHSLLLGVQMVQNGYSAMAAQLLKIHILSCSNTDWHPKCQFQSPRKDRSSYWSKT